MKLSINSEQIAKLINRLSKDYFAQLLIDNNMGPDSLSILDEMLERIKNLDTENIQPHLLRDGERQILQKIILSYAPPISDKAYNNTLYAMYKEANAIWPEESLRKYLVSTNLDNMRVVFKQGDHHKLQYFLEELNHLGPYDDFTKELILMNYMNLGKLHLKHGLYQDAIYDFQIALDIENSDFLAQKYLAKALFHLAQELVSTEKDYATATRHLSQALSYYSYDSKVSQHYSHYALKAAEKMSTDPVERIEFLEKAIKSLPRDSQMNEFLAKEYSKLAKEYFDYFDFSNAKNAYKTSAFYVCCSLGLVNPDADEIFFQDVLSTYPDNELLHYNISYLNTIASFRLESPDAVEYATTTTAMIGCAGESVDIISEAQCGKKSDACRVIAKDYIADAC